MTAGLVVAVVTLALGLAGAGAALVWLVRQHYSIGRELAAEAKAHAETTRRKLINDAELHMVSAELAKVKSSNARQLAALQEDLRAIEDLAIDASDSDQLRVVVDRLLSKASDRGAVRAATSPGMPAAPVPDDSGGD